MQFKRFSHLERYPDFHERGHCTCFWLSASESIDNNSQCGRSSNSHRSAFPKVVSAVDGKRETEITMFTPLQKTKLTLSKVCLQFVVFVMFHLTQTSSSRCTGQVLPLSRGEPAQLATDSRLLLCQKLKEGAKKSMKQPEETLNSLFCALNAH